MEKKKCGAKTRQGTPCKKKPLKNGRCRLHGGKSTGPKNKEKHRESLKGNKNAIVTGEYETISFDTLLDDEKELYAIIPEDINKQVKGRYKILEIRTRRLMQRYTIELEKNKPDFRFIYRIEEALTRIDSRANELIREMRELSINETNDENRPLEQLVSVLDEIRKKNNRSNEMK
ncbi:HGGxSTG domain-containing protein [Alkalihalophilus marmarensis]|uniref:HGGxSTG domain-containing protein n=1 Tax=Alkalihalophilus marmarensis TaxID=521377 RepID=UPI002DBE2195|nr:HGGxSTG domain-containing protein [Alkalihalophilus marmarensis]MEC2073994.1 HGGxSTG domain-containing protein [Alkalihalophilus marmarensis]